MERQTEEKLKLQIKKLESKISKLEVELSKKEIIIDALILKNNVEKRKFDEFEEQEENKKVKINPNEAETTLELESLNTEMVMEVPIIKPVKIKNEKMKKESKEILPGLGFQDSEDSNNLEKTQNLFYFDIPELISQIKQVFLLKNKIFEFKPNFDFRKFVEYCEASYEFSLTNKKISKPKNPLKSFIESHLDGIIKFLIENINNLTLNQICSTFFRIASEIEYQHKLVIFHDIILHLENYSKLSFISSALFNNNNFENDLFSQIIKKIMFHQISIDYDLYKNNEIGEYLDIITQNLGLFSPEISLWDSLSHFMVKHQIFDENKKIVKSEAIEKGFVLRMTCHYLDWHYTFNVFILTQLFPKIISDRTPIHVYYLGILTMNALRLFSRHESVEMLIEELRKILEWKDNCSVVAYLILKQIQEAESVLWLTENEEFLEKLGFDLAYLRQALII